MELDIENALLKAELEDLKKENANMMAIMKRIGDCDWCSWSEESEYDWPCAKCNGGSKFLPNYDLLKIRS